MGTKDVASENRKRIFNICTGCVDNLVVGSPRTWRDELRGQPEGNRAGPLRRLLSLLMVMVATLATIATSPPSSEIRGDHQGLTFDLSPEQPEMRLPFEFSISEPAQDADSWIVDFDFSLVWRDVSEDDRLLEGRLLDGEGQVLQRQAGTSELGLSCRDECIGGGEVVLSWRPGIAEGSVRVDWEAYANAFFETDELPEGATLSFEATDPPTASTSTVVATGITELRSDFREIRKVVARQHVQIETNAANAQHWLELTGLFSPNFPEDASFYVLANGSRTRLTEAGSTFLEPPADCSLPCKWSVDLLLVDENAHSNPAEARWRLTQSGGDPSAVTVVDGDVATLAKTLSGGPLTIGDGEETSTSVSLEVDPEALSVEDFDIHQPQVVLTLTTTVDESQSQFPDRGRLGVAIRGLAPPDSLRVPAENTSIYSDDIDPSRNIISVPAILDCSESGCELEFQIDHETENFGSGQVTLTWELRTELPYPFAQHPPDGVSMSLESG